VSVTARILPAAVAPSADLSLLTSREKAVAELVAAGKSNKEVARDLDITERTVKAHLSAAFEKLQVRDRLQLVLLFSSGANA
jgi:DNA-binding NarL/FixJ family response regulator